MYRYGLARGTLGSTGREVASALATSDTFELDEHGFETGDQVLFRAIQGGALPGGVSAATPYYAIRITSETFKISTAPGGPPIDLTTDGSGVIVSTPLPFDEVLEAYSRFVDTCVPAHVAPFKEPFPKLIVATVATLAAKRLQNLSGTTTNAMGQLEKEARDLLKGFEPGKPLGDANATAPSNLAVVASTAETDPRGWGSGTIP